MSEVSEIDCRQITADAFSHFPSPFIHYPIYYEYTVTYPIYAYKETHISLSLSLYYLVLYPLKYYFKTSAISSFIGFCF